MSAINCIKSVGTKAYPPASYEIIRSPGDGHCILYSVTSSLWYQADVKVNTEYIINVFKDEITSRTLDYIDCFDGSIHDLCESLFAYMNDKIYERSFDDLVHEVIANGMNINVNIIDGLLIHRVPCTRNETNINIFILEVGDHFDGIKTMNHNCIDTSPYRESMGVRCSLLTTIIYQIHM